MNRYDDVRLDIPALLKDQDATLAPWDSRARSGDGLGVLARLRSRPRLAYTALSCRLGAHRRLVHALLDLDWFDEFQRYWAGELGDRPLQPHDFGFLSGVYRQRFQALGDDGPPVDDRALAVWQDPRAIYLLFAHHYRTALRPLAARPFVRFIARGARVCEYGCGAAPMTTSLVRFYRHLDLAITCADIPTVLFHFMRWKFRDHPFVRKVAIDPGDDAPLDGEFDVIFCTEVLEHVPRPLAVLRHLHARLAPRGVLVLDYIRSEAHGLDTVGGLAERPAALDFVAAHFDVLEGSLPLDGRGVETVVCRRR